MEGRSLSHILQCFIHHKCPLSILILFVTVHYHHSKSVFNAASSSQSTFLHNFCLQIHIRSICSSFDVHSGQFHLIVNALSFRNMLLLNNEVVHNMILWTDGITIKSLNSHSETISTLHDVTHPIDVRLCSHRLVHFILNF